MERNREYTGCGEFLAAVFLLGLVAIDGWFLFYYAPKNIIKHRREIASFVKEKFDTETYYKVWFAKHPTLSGQVVGESFLEGGLLQLSKDKYNMKVRLDNGEEMVFGYSGKKARTMDTRYNVEDKIIFRKGFKPGEDKMDEFIKNR